MSTGGRLRSSFCPLGVHMSEVNAGGQRRRLFAVSLANRGAFALEEAVLCACGLRSDPTLLRVEVRSSRGAVQSEARDVETFDGGRSVRFVIPVVPARSTVTATLYGCLPLASDVPVYGALLAGFVRNTLNRRVFDDFGRRRQGSSRIALADMYGCALPKRSAPVPWSEITPTGTYRSYEILSGPPVIPPGAVQGIRSGRGSVAARTDPEDTTVTLYEELVLDVPGTYDLPIEENVRYAVIELYGARGGASTGALGGSAVGTLENPTPGSYTVLVGGAGSDSGAGGLHGGGNGGSGKGARRVAGGGGGGYSALLRGNEILMVAGGGGGGGGLPSPGETSDSYQSTPGGAGAGAPQGLTAPVFSEPSDFVCATETVLGGEGGSNESGLGRAGFASNVIFASGTDGSALVGGAGGAAATVPTDMSLGGGGGGGGGYVGGGGGGVSVCEADVDAGVRRAFAAGGGGGSGYVAPVIVSPEVATAVRSGNGRVIVRLYLRSL